MIYLESYPSSFHSGWWAINKLKTKNTGKGIALNAGPTKKITRLSFLVTTSQQCRPAYAIVRQIPFTSSRHAHSNRDRRQHETPGHYDIDIQPSCSPPPPYAPLVGEPPPLPLQLWHRRRRRPYQHCSLLHPHRITGRNKQPFRPLSIIGHRVLLVTMGLRDGWQCP